MDIEQRKAELTEMYITPFKTQKEELIEEIREYVKFHFNKTPECMYDIRDFINLKDSKFAQSVILTRPQIVFRGIDISYLEGQFLTETYNEAQKVLDEFKMETGIIYNDLAEIVINLMDQIEEQAIDKM